MALAATYAHPLEHVLSNLLPPSVGPILVNAHVTTEWLWFAFILVGTLSDHSGIVVASFSGTELNE